MGTDSTDVGDLRELLRLRPAVPVTVQGDCMAPTLEDGQTVLVLPAEDLRPGEVALLEVGGTLEIHRLLDRVRAGRRTWYVHGGDGSGACGVAGAGDIVGRVAAPACRRSPFRGRLLGLGLRARALLGILMR